MTIAQQPEKIFNLTIDAQEVKVRYVPYWTKGLAPYGHFEFTSPYEPRRRIPVPEQDELRQAFLFYRSHPAFCIGVQIRTPRGRSQDPTERLKA